MNINQQKGLSLVELLVSSVLLGIVIVGVISFSFVVKNIQDSTPFKNLETVVQD